MYMPRYNIYIPLPLRSYKLKGKFNTYVVAQRLILFFSFTFNFFTFERYNFSKVHSILGKDGFVVTMSF